MQEQHHTENTNRPPTEWRVYERIRQPGFFRYETRISGEFYSRKGAEQRMRELRANGRSGFITQIIG